MDLPSAGFEGRELNPAVHEHNFVLYHPGEKGISPAMFRLTGPAGSEVTIEMEHVQRRDYGGHLHDIEPQHLGTLYNQSAGSFEQVSPGMVRFKMREGSATTVRYQPSDICTRRKFTVGQQWSDTTICHTLFVDVRYTRTLYDLNKSDVPHMHLYTGDTTHPSEVSHYGTKEMIDALIGLHQAYGRAFEDGEFTSVTTDDDSLNITIQDMSQLRLHVNDISLPWGGRFKNKGDMSDDAHGTHKWGNDVDINWNRMNDLQRQWMWDNAPNYFSRVDLHGRNDPANTHWHLDL